MFGNVEGCFGLPSVEGGFSWHLVGGGSWTPYHPQAQTTENDPAQNIHHATAENSCSIGTLNALYYNDPFYNFPSKSRASQGQGHCRICHRTPSTSRCLAHSRCSLNVGQITEEGNECPDGLLKRYPRNWIPGRHEGSFNGYCIRNFQLQDVFPPPFQK